MIELRTFGSAELYDGERREVRAVLAQPKRFALLTYLAVAHDGGVCRRDTLLSVFWPELDEDHARSSLRQAMRFLRRSVGADVIESRGENEIGVRRGTLACDAVAFTAAIVRRDLAQALELYRAEFLEGFFVSGAPEFERWTERKRDDFRWSAFRAASELATAAEFERELEPAAEWARRAALLAPFDEGAHRRLILLRAKLGDRSGALHAYDEFARRLAAEYELEPAPETRALISSIQSTNRSSPDTISVHSGLARAVEKTPETRPVTERSIAVLPFASLSADRDGDYLGDGIADEIMTALNRLSGLRITSRTAAFRFKGKDYDLKEVRLRLAVDVVLEGTVSRVGNTLRVTSRLTDVNSGFLIWAESFEREFTDVLVVQEKIAQMIVRALNLRLKLGNRQPLIARHTEDLEAYNLYLKGRYHWNKRPRETMKGLEFFQHAIKRDPHFALAHAGIADCFATLGSWEASALPAREAFPKAEAAALRALELDRNLAESFASLGYTNTHYHWRWPEAGDQFERALTIDPTNAHSYHWYAHYLMALGRIDESLAASERSCALDPLDVIINVHFAWHFWLTRQYDESVERALRTRELNQHDHWVPYFLGLAYGQKQLHGQAIAEHRKAVRRSAGSPVMLGALGHSYVIGGKHAEAREVLRQLEDLSATKHVSAYEIAVIYVALGEIDRAFDWLDRAYDERSAWLPYLRLEPRLDPVRNDARFTKVLTLLQLNDMPSSVKSLPNTNLALAPQVPGRR